MTELLAHLTDLSDFGTDLPKEVQAQILERVSQLHQQLPVDLSATGIQIPPVIRRLKQRILDLCGADHLEFAQYLNRSAMCAITGRTNLRFTRQFGGQAPTPMMLYLSGLNVALIEYMLEKAMRGTLSSDPALLSLFS